MTKADTTRIRELQVGETYLAHSAMRALRTSQESEHGFVEYVDGVLRPKGYRLIGAFVSDREQAVAVAGFHTDDSLALGHHLYVDDLSTSPMHGAKATLERCWTGSWRRDEGWIAVSCTWIRS